MKNLVDGRIINLNIKAAYSLENRGYQLILPIFTIFLPVNNMKNRKDMAILFSGGFKSIFLVLMVQTPSRNQSLPCNHTFEGEVRYHLKGCLIIFLNYIVMFYQSTVSEKF